MFRFVARRLLESIPVMFVIVTVTFFMLRLMPGGPFTSERALPPEVLKNLNAHYGFDQPLWKQYLANLWNVCPKRCRPDRLCRDANGDGRADWDLKTAFGIDFGPSTKYANRTVNEVIADALPASLELGGLALAVALAVGLPLGVIAAARRNSWLDYLASGVSMVGICVPTFVLGPVLVLVFAIGLRQFNASGWYAMSDRVLPAATLGLVYAAYLARLTRGGMLEVLTQDYIRTARAKGASEWRVVFKHALRGGLLPVVSFLGPAAAGILTGSFVIETIFQIPGLGREFVKSAANQDRSLVIGLVVLYAAMVVFFNLVVDLLQVWLNPRLKLE
jgi:oligopeptide transport system permease protein